MLFTGLWLFRPWIALAVVGAVLFASGIWSVVK